MFSLTSLLQKLPSILWPRDPSEPCVPGDCAIALRWEPVCTSHSSSPVQESGVTYLVISWPEGDTEEGLSTLAEEAPLTPSLLLGNGLHIYTALGIL